MISIYRSPEITQSRFDDELDLLMWKAGVSSVMYNPQAMSGSATPCAIHAFKIPLDNP